MPTMNTALDSPVNIPAPDDPAVTYTAGTGGDLGTVTASASKVAPKWLTWVLIAAGVYILFKE